MNLQIHLFSRNGFSIENTFRKKKIFQGNSEILHFTSQGSDYQ